MKRPVGVTVIAILFFLVVAVALFAGVDRVGAWGTTPAQADVAGPNLFLAAMSLGVGLMLLRMHRAAWTWALEA